jgi:hypothetical protein
MAFKQEIADEICREIADTDKSLRTICGEIGIAPSTICLWAENNPQFAEQYARARSIKLDWMADDVPHIADTQEIGTTRTIKADGGIEEKTGDMVEHRRLRIEARKWYLGKLAPKKYGDKLAIGGADDLPPIKTMPDEALAARIKALQDKVSSDDPG